jgi:hypothetical protein
MQGSKFHVYAEFLFVYFGIRVDYSSVASAPDSWTERGCRKSNCGSPQHTLSISRVGCNIMSNEI